MDGKRVPYGVSDYGKLITGGFYYVDKSWVIRELERVEAPLFLRPRRFGKSLLCSMLGYYYDIRQASRFGELFGDTVIGRNPTPRHNSYNVVTLNLASVGTGGDLLSLERKFTSAIRCQLAELLFNRGFGMEPGLGDGSAEEMLAHTMLLLRTQHDVPAYLIIDEYDNFTNQLIQAGQDGLYYQAVGKDSFLKTFFKKIKEWLGNGNLANCFLTGVLPVTQDDLTSGFNIADNVTMEETLQDALGFTEDEVRGCVSEMFRDYSWPQELYPKVLEDLRDYYDGYLLLPEARHHLYNPTICNYYLRRLLAGNGKLPLDYIDSNISLDLGWLERLAGSVQASDDFINRLVLGGGVDYERSRLNQQFNLSYFLNAGNLPTSLYFLGQLTWDAPGRLVFPNLTIRLLFLEKFNELNRCGRQEEKMRQAFRNYLSDGDFPKLFERYWQIYVPEFPAAAFAHIHEAFFQMTFFYYCHLFMQDGMRPKIEENLPAGQSDLTFEGIPGTAIAGKAVAVEFKHFRKNQKLPELPRTMDVEQVTAYADNKARSLRKTVLRYIVYTYINSAQKVFALD